MAHVYFSLGTNLGDRRYNLRRALDYLQQMVHIEAVSAIYETEPWGPVQEQPHFYNLCAAGQTQLAPPELLDFVKRAEVKIGREGGDRWGPRLIDIDILFYDDVIWESERLRIPHAQIAERAFVLVPLAEIAPNFVHPELGQSVQALAAAVDKTGVTRLEENVYDA